MVTAEFEGLTVRYVRGFSVDVVECFIPCTLHVHQNSTSLWHLSAKFDWHDKILD